MHARKKDIIKEYNDLRSRGLSDEQAEYFCAMLKKRDDDNDEHYISRSEFDTEAALLKAEIPRLAAIWAVTTITALGALVALIIGLIALGRVILQ